MKKLINNRFLLLFLLVFVSAWCQGQTAKAVESAIFNSRFTPDPNPYRKYRFDVWNCDLDYGEFCRFFSNPEYKTVSVITGERVKYRKKIRYVKNFCFETNSDVMSGVEFCVRVVNRNLGLKMPSLKNVAELNNYYQSYVKPHSQLVSQFKQYFTTEFPKICQNDPGFVKSFCDNSPYANNELVGWIDMFSVLNNCQVNQKYVFYQTANSGCVFGGNGDYKYVGQISNRLPNGQGKNVGKDGEWEGTFVNGVVSGNCSHTTTSANYPQSETGNGNIYMSNIYTFHFKQTGNYVNGRWEGIVTMEVSAPKYTSLKDVEQHQYLNGQLVRKTLVKNELSNYMRDYLRRQKENEDDIQRRIAAAKNSNNANNSSVTVDNIMNYVKSIDFYYNDSDGDRAYYTVKFTNGSEGEIVYQRSSGKWGGENGGILEVFDFPSNNSKAAAILVLYRYKNR